MVRLLSSSSSSGSSLAACSGGCARHQRQQGRGRRDGHLDERRPRRQPRRVQRTKRRALAALPRRQPRQRGALIAGAKTGAIVKDVRARSRRSPASIGYVAAGNLAAAPPTPRRPACPAGIAIPVAGGPGASGVANAPSAPVRARCRGTVERRPVEGVEGAAHHARRVRLRRGSENARVDLSACVESESGEASRARSSARLTAPSIVTSTTRTPGLGKRSSAPLPHPHRLRSAVGRARNS